MVYELQSAHNLGEKRYNRINYQFQQNFSLVNIEKNFKIHETISSIFNKQKVQFFSNDLAVQLIDRQTE
jgi:hypothetical protein